MGKRFPRACRGRLGLPILVLLGLLSPALLQAQSSLPDAEEIERRLEKITRNPLVRELLERGKKPALTPAQKEVLGRAVDEMKDEEILALLERHGYSTEGSVHARRERLKLVLGVIAPPELPRKKAAPSIAIENASEGEYMRGEQDDRGILKLRGRIRVRVPSGVFTADLVIVDTKRKEVYAEGNLVYEGADGMLSAERIIYNQELGTGIIYNAQGYLKPLRFIGRTMTQQKPGRFALSHAHFTSCAAERPHFSFTARRVWVHEGRRIVAAGVLYYVGGVPLLPLPFLYASEWGTGIISQAGYGRIQGFFLQNTYQFSVPEASFSMWQPMMYRFTLDYYQNTGEAAGMELYRFAPGLNYVLQFGGARYRRYELISDFREKDSIRVTNRVQHSDGTYGKEYYRWNKAFALINAKSRDMRNNHNRNVHLRYEGYTHQLYEFEFGGRYQPNSTIPALYENSESGRGLVRPTTNWNLTYNEQWDDLSLRVEAARSRLWIEQTDFRDSRYFPTADIVPSVDLRKRFKLFQLPYFETPVYWEHGLHSDLKKEYSTGDLFRSLNTNEYDTHFRTYLSFYPWITIAPKIGYGARRVSARDVSDTANDEILEREARKGSYQYYFTEDEFTVGPDVLYLRATYRRKDSFKEELADAPELYLPWTEFEDRQKINETEATLGTRPMRDLEFSITSVYDHRELPFETSYRNRWSYPVARLDWTIDFLNFGREGRENLLSRRKLHFVQLRLTDDYVYDFVKQRDHSNVFGINFQTGGFDLWLLRSLRYFEAGFYWYHVYYNPELDHMRYSVKLDLQLTKYWYFELELESRATEVERYSRRGSDGAATEDYVRFEHDIVDGTGLNGPRKRQEAVFNTGFFEAALIWDLHEWELRFGYQLEQKSILAGLNSLEVVNFYDNKVFFSMTLLRFDLGGASQRPSRFIINRRRVRARDLGRSSISSTRLN